MDCDFRVATVQVGWRMCELLIADYDVQDGIHNKFSDLKPEPVNFYPYMNCPMLAKAEDGFTQQTGIFELLAIMYCSFAPHT